MIGPFAQGALLMSIIFWYSKNVFHMINEFYRDEFKKTVIADIPDSYPNEIHIKDNDDTPIDNDEQMDDKSPLSRLSPTVDGISDILKESIKNYGDNGILTRNFDDNNCQKLRKDSTNKIENCIIINERHHGGMNTKFSNLNPTVYNNDVNKMNTKSDNNGKKRFSNEKLNDNKKRKLNLNFEENYCSFPTPTTNKNELNNCKVNDGVLSNRKMHFSSNERNQKFPLNHENNRLISGSIQKKSFIEGGNAIIREKIENKNLKFNKKENLILPIGAVVAAASVPIPKPIPVKAVYKTIEKVEKKLPIIINNNLRNQNDYQNQVNENLNYFNGKGTTSSSSHSSLQSLAENSNKISINDATNIQQHSRKHGNFIFDNGNYKTPSINCCNIKNNNGKITQNNVINSYSKINPTRSNKSNKNSSTSTPVNHQTSTGTTRKLLLHASSSHSTNIDIDYDDINDDGDDDDNIGYVRTINEKLLQERFEILKSMHLARQQTMNLKLKSIAIDRNFNEKFTTRITPGNRELICKRKTVYEYINFRSNLPMN